jgi:hypothetical protein
LVSAKASELITATHPMAKSSQWTGAWFHPKEIVAEMSATAPQTTRTRSSEPFRKINVMLPVLYVAQGSHRAETKSKIDTSS